MTGRGYSLTSSQLELIERPLNGCIFLEGAAGCGKTSAAVERLLYLMENGIPGQSILLLTPQRTLVQPYMEALRQPGVIAGGQVTTVTIGGLARRMLDLFWPLAAAAAGFGHPEKEPVFLTLETAQYYMATLTRPLLEEGYFDSVTMDRNRLYSQILDNLNKSALVGFLYTEIGERLKSAWVGEPAQTRVYNDAQECATRFRKYCLENNLLDFSLQVELFWRVLWPEALCRETLQNTYRHLIVDNLEEDTPVTHDLLRAWLPKFESALLVYDHDAGFRSFLGADQQTGYALKDLCQENIRFTKSFVTSKPIHDLEKAFTTVLSDQSVVLGVRENHPDDDYRPAFDFEFQRFFPQMLDQVAARIASLIKNDGVPAGEIAVLAPFLSDALRFSLTNRLQEIEIPARSHRPSRALRDDPATQCMLALIVLAHPQWAKVFPITKFDVIYALVQAIEGLDLARAQLLAQITFRLVDGQPSLTSFDRINPEVQERITFACGQRYEKIRLWLEEYRQGETAELDHFICRLFGEVLSQPGFGFHSSFTAGEVIANLVESVQKFRRVAGSSLGNEKQTTGEEYMQMVRAGVIAAQYLRSWQEEESEAVMLAPATTFLISNRPVEVQFWLDVGSRGWFERLSQPLTHPYVLSRNWPARTLWTDEAENQASRKALCRLTTGLLRRCKSKVIFCHSEFGEQGYEQRGQLLYAIQRVLQYRAGGLYGD